MAATNLVLPWYARQHVPPVSQVTIGPSRPSTDTDAVSTSLVIPDRVLQFLNALPVTGEPLEWIPAFRNALCLLLGDVDRVTVEVNIGCDLRNPETYSPGVFITSYNSARSSENEPVLVSSGKVEVSQSERLLEYMRHKGFPTNDYHPPHALNYYLGTQAYLGTIFLWRHYHEEPISKTTLEIIASLESFIIFAFSDLVARRQYSRPADKTFLDAMESLTGAAGLSRQEQRVIILQLFGHSYKEMADMLGISVDGVKHHLKMIHRKTGARSYTELFAKYFMPRFDLQDNDDEVEDTPVVEDSVKDNLFAVIRPPVQDRSSEAYFVRNTDLGERIRKFGELVYDSVEDFARAMKIAPSNVQKYFNGERNPGLGTLQRLNELGCNINALISAEGPMFADNDSGRELWKRFGVAVTLEASDDKNDAASD